MSKPKLESIEVAIRIDGVTRVYDIFPDGYGDRGTNLHDETGVSDSIMDTFVRSLFNADGEPTQEFLRNVDTEDLA